MSWTKATLEDLCEFNPKHAPEIDRTTTVSFVPMPAVDDETGAIIHKSTIRPLSDVWKGYTHFADADVIFAKITPCMENGKIAVARDLQNGMACGSTEFHVLRSKGAVEPSFIWRFLRQRSFRQNAELSMTGAVGQRRVPKPFLEATELPLPPLAEQQRIVAKLDALNAKSARARTELARIETLVSRYKQAVLSKTFGGDLSGSWPKMQIGRAAVNIFDGPFGSNLKSADYTSEGPRVIRLENIGARVFIEEKRTHVSDEKFNSLARHQLQADDLLFSSFVSEEIRACLFPEDVNFQAINKADCFCIRFDKSKIYPQFALLQLTADDTYRHFVQQVHGATRPRINLSQLKSHVIFIPPLAEQQRILSRVESAFAKIDRLADEAKRALAMLGKLDEAILAKAFRGELVPQDENDEPASVLLDRIRAEREASPKLSRRRKGVV